MPVTLTKAQLSKILVEERKKSRTKHQQSAFMRRTLSIYKGQENRLAEAWIESNKRLQAIADEAGRPVTLACLLPSALPYTLSELRQGMSVALEGGKCCYCPCKLTLKRITADHKESLASGGSWNLANLAFCCQSCNWQKGRLSTLEFRRLLKFCDKYLSPESAADVKKRLSLGGKWTPK